MKGLKVFTMLATATLLFVGFQPRAKASDLDSKMILTLDAPVEVPGSDVARVIPPGTYVFRVMNFVDQNIVTVSNADETHVVATILAVPDFRYHTSASPVVRFGENAAGSPAAIREIFYPGNSYGWAFVYPKAPAMQTAKANKRNVLCKVEG
jgi:hypothetical protein